MSDDVGTSVDQVFAAARHQLLVMHPADEEGRMLQSSGLKTAGKFYGFATTTDLVVKLPSSRVNELIAEGRGPPAHRDRDGP